MTETADLNKKHGQHEIRQKIGSETMCFERICISCARRDVLSNPEKRRNSDLQN
jgi:hypothetical protein